MSFVFVYVPKPRFVIALRLPVAGRTVANCGLFGCQLQNEEKKQV